MTRSRPLSLGLCEQEIAGSIPAGSILGGKLTDAHFEQAKARLLD